MSFHSERLIKGVRKARHCDACGNMIEVGEPAIGWAGTTDGDFGTLTYHPECRAAEIALNELQGNRYDDWWPIRDMEWDDFEWVLAEYPIVAARMNITAERIERIKAERERTRLAWAEIARRTTPPSPNPA